MDQPLSEGIPEQPRISDRVVINGTEMPLALTQDGLPKWTTEKGQPTCLTMEEELLGLVSERSRLRIKVIVENRDGVCCVGNKRDGSALVGKDFVFEPLHVHSQNLWCQHLRE